MSGWVRGQFEDNYIAAHLDAPPNGKLEAYAQYVLTQSARHQSEDDDVIQSAREAMFTAAVALLEFAGRGRPRKPRYASSAPKASTSSIRNRTAAIRARYGGRS